MSVYEPVLKSTNQGWWTFQNGKLMAWEQIIFKKKGKVTLILNKHIVCMKTVHAKLDEWFLICTHATILELALASGRAPMSNPVYALSRRGIEQPKSIKKHFPGHYIQSWRKFKDFSRTCIEI